MVSLARWRYILPAVNLPDKLQLLVAAHVAAPRDRAALCIAGPPLGRKAIKAIPASYKGPLMSLSNRVLSGLADALNEVAQLNSLVAPSVGLRFVLDGSNLEWRLESGALLRCWKPYEGVCNTRPSELAPAMHHYEGVVGDERLVSVAFAGYVLGFKGPRGDEKVVSGVC